MTVCLERNSFSGKNLMGLFFDGGVQLWGGGGGGDFGSLCDVHHFHLQILFAFP